MHEHQLARDIWPSLQQVAMDNHLVKVTAVVLDVGMFHSVEPDFLIHSFEHVFEGTCFEGAQVDIHVIEPGQIIQSEDQKDFPATGHEIIIRSLTGERE